MGDPGTRATAAADLVGGEEVVPGGRAGGLRKGGKLLEVGVGFFALGLDSFLSMTWD